MFRFPAAVFLLLLLVADGVRSQNVGDTVCVEGFIMDDYCITDGFLLDNPSVITLEGPDQHSVHCLVDPGVCNGSDFTILAEPTTEGGLYTVAYKFDTTGKEIVLKLAREQGDPDNYCSTCTGGGTVKMGFRAEVTGIVLDERSPPTLQVLAALPSNGREDQACVMPTEPPSRAPSLEIPAAEPVAEPGPVVVSAPTPATPSTSAPAISDGTLSTRAPAISADKPTAAAPTTSPSFAETSPTTEEPLPTLPPAFLPTVDGAPVASSAGTERVIDCITGVMLLAFFAAVLVN